MGLIRSLIQEFTSEMGNRQSRQSYEPAYGAAQNQSYNYVEPQPQRSYGCCQTKRQRKAERRLMRADARAERTAMMRSYGGGCCGKRRAAPPMQVSGQGYAGGSRVEYGYESRRDYVDAPPGTQGYIEDERTYDRYSDNRDGLQESGFESVPEKKGQKPPPAYEDVV